MVKSPWPAVSCIVNTFERADLLPRALASVMSQLDDFDDFEVIVVDDASDDAGATAKVIKQWADWFDKRGVAFVSYRLGENSGAQSVPKNQGIIHARGSYIRFLDDDNEWAPGSLAVLMAAIEEGDVWPDLVYGRREYVLDVGAPATGPGGITLPIGPSSFVPFDRERIAAGPQYNYIDTGDFIASKGAYWWLHEHTGNMWNPAMRRFGDYELIARASHLDKLVGAVPWRFKGIESIVSRYHWTGRNLQLTRLPNETPVPVNAATGKRL